MSVSSAEWNAVDTTTCVGPLARDAFVAQARDAAEYSAATSAVCGDLGLSPDVADALLVISRIPGLCAHVIEEQTREKPMRVVDALSHHYDGPPERRVRDRRTT